MMKAFPTVGGNIDKILDIGRRIMVVMNEREI